MSAVRFPWQEAMTLGLGRLRLAPEIFWRLTLPELAAAARALGQRGDAPMARGELEGLMTRFPDAPPTSSAD